MPSTPEENSASTMAVDPENKKKLKYPKSVFFIISNEFCERFSYYGMRTILSIYLQNKLKYTESNATLIYHSFVMLCYFFPLFGAIIADSYLGKYRTILYLSIVYACGTITISYSSTGFVPFSESTLSLIGLLLIAMGTGGIKPCVSSFGGDQFVLPEQERQLQQFFSIFYFSINAGSLISTFLTPELRQDVKCLGQDTCYPLAFGVPAILMVVSLLIFVAGKWMYKMKKPTGNIIVDVTKCSLYAVSKKVSSKQRKDHWLDYASDKFDSQLIDDTKIIMSLIVLFSPTVLFWSLFEQQGTSWTFQATRLSGELGSYTIKPDQMQVANPILILLFIPIFESIIYPILYKLHLIRTSLHKMFVGGLLVALAFAVAGLLEQQIQPTYSILPKEGEAQLRIVNGFDCNISLAYNDNEKSAEKLDGLDILQLYSLHAKDSKTLQFSFQSADCPGFPPEFKANLEITEKQSVTYLLKKSRRDSSPTLSRIGEYDTLDKLINGNAQLRVIYSTRLKTNLVLLDSSKKPVATFEFLPDSDYANIKEIPRGRYSLRLNGKDLPGEIELHFAGVYTLLIDELNDKQPVIRLYTITKPNSVHILWQLPQIIILTAAEIMFSITGLEFSYSQAPKSMKSVISSLWLLTDSVGNLIVVFMAELLKLDNQVFQFFMFAGLMVIVMGIFLLLAMRYKYQTPKSDDDYEYDDINGTVNPNPKDNPAFNLDE